MDNIGGAEIVALTLARGFDADLYTTNIDQDKIVKMGFVDVLPRIISIGKLPINAPFRQQLALWKFRRLNLGNKYDCYIIAGDWAMSGAVNNKPNIWYVHSPLNELWHYKDYIRKILLTWWKRPIFDIWVWFNRKLSLKYAKSVDVWLCNSNNTKNRIKKYYGKDAAVVFPSMDTKLYSCGQDKGYWLSVNRLLVHKRVDEQIKAFKKLPDQRLVIVGSYEKGSRQFEAYKKYIESIKPSNVEIIHWVDDQKLKQLYAKCRGFITTAMDEDFGLTPVEAMASGKPVVAVDEGGYKETVIHGKTGLLIKNTDELVQAINSVNARVSIDPYVYRDACLDRAKQFDVSVFLDKINSAIPESRTQ